MVFKNHRLQIGFVNASKPTATTPTEDIPPVDVSRTIRETTETIAQYAILGVVAYVTADTLRQVVVKAAPYAKLPKGYF